MKLRDSQSEVLLRKLGQTCRDAQCDSDCQIWFLSSKKRNSCLFAKWPHVGPCQSAACSHFRSQCNQPKLMNYFSPPLTQPFLTSLQLYDVTVYVCRATWVFQFNGIGHLIDLLAHAIFLMSLGLAIQLESKAFFQASVTLVAFFTDQWASIRVVAMLRSYCFLLFLCSRICLLLSGQDHESWNSTTQVLDAWGERLQAEGREDPRCIPRVRRMSTVQWVQNIPLIALMALPPPTSHPSGPYRTARKTDTKPIN